MDDKRGRRVAKQLELKHTGTLGVLTRARKGGLVDDLRSLLEQLVALDFRIDAELLRRALMEVGELRH